MASKTPAASSLEITRKQVSSACMLIACDVFADELEQLGVDKSMAVFLEMGLHDAPDRLRAELQETIDRLEYERPALQAIALGFGRCGNALVGLRARRCRLAIPRADDCVALFMGGGVEARKTRIRNPDRYYASPGWTRAGLLPGPEREDALRRLWASRHANDAEIMEELVAADRETFQRCRALHYLETGPRNESARQTCARCAAANGWRLESSPADLSLLCDLITFHWDSSRFLVVEPGATVIASDDSRILSSR